MFHQSGDMRAVSVRALPDAQLGVMVGPSRMNNNRASHCEHCSRIHEQSKFRQKAMRIVKVRAPRK